MAKNSSDRDIFANVIITLAMDAASEVSGVYLVLDRRSHRSVGVRFLQNEKVCVDLFVNVALGEIIPSKVAELQERVKARIESATKFNVNAVNVVVNDVNVDQ